MPSTASNNPEGCLVHGNRGELPLNNAFDGAFQNFKAGNAQKSRNAQCSDRFKFLVAVGMIPVGTGVSQLIRGQAQHIVGAVGDAVEGIGGSGLMNPSTSPPTPSARPQKG